jgi:hypothetical protein
MLIFLNNVIDDYINKKNIINANLGKKTVEQTPPIFNKIFISVAAKKSSNFAQK